MSPGTVPLPPPKLDERLAEAAACFPACERGADIGADHGRLSCWLLAKGRCRHMTVSDISAASLEKAKALLAKHGLDHLADFVVADGFDAINGPVGAVAICGIGGLTIAGMLENAWRAGAAPLVISAQGRQPAVREGLAAAGYSIPQERVLRSAGRFYTVICARRAPEAYTARQLFVGPSLVGSVSAGVAEYLQWRLAAADRERGPAGGLHRTWIREAIGDAQRNSPNDIQMDRFGRTF